MKAFLFLAILSTVICVSVSASAATLYVDNSVSSSGDGASWATAFKKIQEGIDAASPADNVIVAEGTYVENIQFSGKNIVLTSADPLDPSVVAGTVIDGNQAGSVVTFSGTETETCVLSGFTVRNGNADYGGGIYGGTDPHYTHATIQNNTITGSSALEEGGGLAGCAGTIQKNTITGNRAQYYGGGLWSCGGTIQNNTITGNSATYQSGGGLAYCGGTIENNTITGNSAQGGGGGLGECHGTIQNNTITGNSAGGGGGLWLCNGTIQNNTIAANSAADSGGGLVFCGGTIQNNTITANSATNSGGGLALCGGTIHSCIIWRNTAATGPQLYQSSIPNFSCIQGWSKGGQGNIASEPRFVNPNARDYHLQLGSPCIDAAANYYWFPCPQRDRDGNCRLVGLAVDMGCYEYGSSSDLDGDLLSDSDESAAGTDPLKEDSDGDGLRDGLELLRGSNPLQVTPPGILNVPSDVPTIQGSLCVSIAGDEIIVSPGTYRENLQFCGPDIILRSSDPGDTNVVGSTIVDGGGAGPVVSLTGLESEACVLAGFTIRNGRSDAGGGIKGQRTHATIQNNTITGNSAADSGGGLYRCSGTIQDNVITANSATGVIAVGGGLSECNGTIQNNTVAGNSAQYDCGGLALCGGTIRNNTITGNSAVEGGGGGLGGCNGTIENNVITANSATYAGGGGLGECNGTIQSNTITGNSAEYGGGLYYCNGTIQNNTITGNSAEVYGGGLRGCNGTIRNCIIWGNTAPSGPQLYDSSMPTYCCIEGWNGQGRGNIAPPSAGFVNPQAHDYHLQEGSPCIDAAANHYWFTWPQRDLDGNCRLVGLAVDMGCYEYGSSADADGDLLSDADESAAGTDPVRDDSDGDGLRDGLEVLRGSDPLQVTPPGILNVPSEIATIQQSLCVSMAGDEIIVAPGTYPENLQFCGPDIILRSSDPGDPDVVASTILDGGGAGPVVSFTGGESGACVLAGFTIGNGKTWGSGGGIKGSGTLATIQNNTITGNEAGEAGGGLAYCGGTIQNNTITGNTADYGGGGVDYCNGTIQNNTITGNSAGGFGGGLRGCGGTIQNNTITGNRAEYYGGGLDGCNGTIQNNTITGNSADYGGGGLYFCNGTIRNCIIWGNTAPSGPQLYDSGVPTYSCIEGWTGDSKKRNISGDPRFAGPDTGDFRLSPSSPCIDAGYNAPDLPEMDIAGMHRVMFGGKSLTVDMGAYEYYVNALSRELGGNTVLTWSSLAGKSYRVEHSSDMLTWEIAAENVPSLGNTVTTWTDTTAPFTSPSVRTRYYRTVEWQRSPSQAGRGGRLYCSRVPYCALSGLRPTKEPKPQRFPPKAGSASVPFVVFVVLCTAR